LPLGVDDTHHFLARIRAVSGITRTKCMPSFSVTGEFACAVGAPRRILREEPPVRRGLVLVVSASFSRYPAGLNSGPAGEPDCGRAAPDRRGGIIGGELAERSQPTILGGEIECRGQRLDPDFLPAACLFL